MTPQRKNDERESRQGNSQRIIRRLKGIEAKVDEVLSRQEEHRHLLQDILDNTGRDNGHGTDWYDLYEPTEYE